MTDTTSGLPTASATGAAAPGQACGTPTAAVAAYGLFAIIFILLTTLPFASDYVGPDNDDAMRLVAVRDLLAGQNWFDTTQYRLGLAGGTPMHWSRVVDLPIANLIDFLGLFLAPPAAEAVALAVWPSLLVVPVLAGAALAGLRLGGRTAMHAALVLATIYLLSLGRFRPGAIDHHNVQLALIVLIVAMLVDPFHRARSYGLAGMLCGLALAIGVETTPLIAVLCLVVALRWGWHGEPYRRAAAGFGMALAATTTLLFFATVPPSHYRQVTCDSLSYGFYALATYGGAALFLAASIASGWSGRMRLLTLACTGAALSAVVLLVAPACVRNPLADLDPMLHAFWLSTVTEAQSIVGQWRYRPAPLGAFYIPGLVAILVCLLRIGRRDRVEAHLTLMAPLAVAFAITVFQVRGNVFANLLAIPPLALAIADLRQRAVGEGKGLAAGLGFAAFTLACVPPAWAVAGALVAKFSGHDYAAVRTAAGQTTACESRESMAALAAEPAGVVAASSDIGAEILRFTGHRALSAPYHRNQGGMLTELHIGLSEPAQAEAFLRGAGVTLLAFCPTDGQVRRLAEAEPHGLYAQLRAGKVPAYLEPVNNGESRLQVFRVRPEKTGSAD